MQGITRPLSRAVASPWIGRQLSIRLNSSFDFRDFDAFCFDVDCTIVTEDGMDRLAKFKGVGKKVADLTNMAMSGKMSLQESVDARLKLLAPSVEDFRSFLQQNPPILTEGSQAVVKFLQRQGKPVFIVSGGLRQLVAPVASLLQIPAHRVFANSITFHWNGAYHNFLPSEYTSQDEGKAKVLTEIQRVYGYQRMVMIGDGVTDLQARPPAAYFIGYGGVIERPAVKQNADWYITNHKELLARLEQTVA